MRPRAGRWRLRRRRGLRFEPQAGLGDLGHVGAQQLDRHRPTEAQVWPAQISPIPPRPIGRSSRCAPQAAQLEIRHEQWPSPIGSRTCPPPQGRSQDSFRSQLYIRAMGRFTISAPRRDQPARRYSPGPAGDGCLTAYERTLVWTGQRIAESEPTTSASPRRVAAWNPALVAHVVAGIYYFKALASNEPIEKLVAQAVRPGPGDDPFASYDHAAAPGSRPGGHPPSSRATRCRSATDRSREALLIHQADLLIWLRTSPRRPTRSYDAARARGVLAEHRTVPSSGSRCGPGGAYGAAHRNQRRHGPGSSPGVRSRVPRRGGPRARPNRFVLREVHLAQPG